MQVHWLTCGEGRGRGESNGKGEGEGSGYKLERVGEMEK